MIHLNSKHKNLQKREIIRRRRKFSPPTHLLTYLFFCYSTQQDKEAGKEVAPYKKPLCIQYGLSHVIHLIERKAAKLVAIASDVDPIELVVYLPALCQKMGVPYCIVKNKSRLGKLVDKKTATCVCLTGVESGDQKKLQQVSETCMTMFNDNSQANRSWGGGNMGLKTTKRLEIRARMLAAEQAKKNKY